MVSFFPKKTIICSNSAFYATSHTLLLKPDCCSPFPSVGAAFCKQEDCKGWVKLTVHSIAQIYHLIGRNNFSINIQIYFFLNSYSCIDCTILQVHCTTGSCMNYIRHEFLMMQQFSNNHFHDCLSTIFGVVALSKDRDRMFFIVYFVLNVLTFQ